MSYIRCLNNPEGLYIWGEKGGRVAITTPNKQIQYIPTYIFEGILKRYVKYGQWKNEIRYRGAKIKEVFIINKRQTKLAKILKIKDGKYQMRLSYKDWYIDMWETTLYYLAFSNEKKYKEK